METKLDERFLEGVSILLPTVTGMYSYLLMDVQLPEDFRRIKQVVLLEDPVQRQYVLHATSIMYTYFFPFHARRGRLRISAIQYPLIRNRKVRKA